MDKLSFVIDAKTVESLIKQFKPEIRKAMVESAEHVLDIAISRPYARPLVNTVVMILAAHAAIASYNDMLNKIGPMTDMNNAVLKEE